MAEGEGRPRSGFGGAMTGALAAAAIVAAGLLWWAMQSPDPAQPPEPQLAATPAPEAANAQAFPGDYIVTGNKGEQQKQAGNAVAVNVAAWLGARVVAALDKART